MRNVNKKPTMKTDMFISGKGNTNDIEENIEDKNNKNLDLPMVDSYSHAVAMIYMYWREGDATDCLDSSVLSHLFHSLYIADNVNGMITQYISCNLNPFESNSRNSLKLRIRYRVFADTTII